MKCIELFYQDCIAENNIAVSKKSRDDVIRETAFIIMFSCVYFFMRFCSYYLLLMWMYFVKGKTSLRRWDGRRVAIFPFAARNADVDRGQQYKYTVLCITSYALFSYCWLLMLLFEVSWLGRFVYCYISSLWLASRAEAIALWETLLKYFCRLRSSVVF